MVFYHEWGIEQSIACSTAMQGDLPKSDLGSHLTFPTHTATDMSGMKSLYLTSEGGCIRSQALDHGL